MNHNPNIVTQFFFTQCDFPGKVGDEIDTSEMWGPYMTAAQANNARYEMINPLSLTIIRVKWDDANDIHVLDAYLTVH